MEEIKYGRGFKLSNGEIEYIELSEKVEHSYNRDDAILNLKRKVDKYHQDTEKSLIHDYPGEAADEEMSAVKRWFKAVGIVFVLLLITVVVGCVFACLPVWLKLTIAVALILYMVYLFARKEK